MDATGPFAIRHLFVKMARNNAALSVLGGQNEERVLQFFDEFPALMSKARDYRRVSRYECPMAAVATTCNRAIPLPRTHWQDPPMPLGYIRTRQGIASRRHQTEGHSDGSAIFATIADQGRPVSWYASPSSGFPQRQCRRR